MFLPSRKTSAEPEFIASWETSNQSKMQLIAGKFTVNKQSASFCWVQRSLSNLNWFLSFTMMSLIRICFKVLWCQPNHLAASFYNNFPSFFHQVDLPYFWLNLSRSLLLYIYSSFKDVLIMYDFIELFLILNMLWKSISVLKLQKKWTDLRNWEKPRYKLPNSKESFFLIFL